MRVICAIDPGIVTVGYAVFPAAGFLNTGKNRCPRPIAAGEHTLAWRGRTRTNQNKVGSPELNALKMARFVEDALRPYRVDQLWVEKMEFRSNAQGIAAIDDVMGVMFACGIYAKLAETIGAAFHPAPVSKWKGQLSKAQVVSRVTKRWKIDDSLAGTFEALKILSPPEEPSHDWDAVGVGLWAAGFFG